MTQTHWLSRIGFGGSFLCSASPVLPISDLLTSSLESHTMGSLKTHKINLNQHKLPSSVSGNAKVKSEVGYSTLSKLIATYMYAYVFKRAKYTLTKENVLLFMEDYNFYNNHIQFLMTWQIP